MSTKTGTSGPDTINGTGADDTIYGLGGGDTLYGNDGNDVLFGGLGKDIIRGQAGNDTLYGDSGNDTLIGGTGKDTLWGGVGTDTFRFQAASDSQGSNVDLIKDFSAVEQDKVDLTALGPALLQSHYYSGFSGLQGVLAYNSATNITTLSYYQGSATPIFQVQFAGNVQYDKFAFLGLSISHFPTDGEDILTGTLHNDIIVGGGGNDTIDGDHGFDRAGFSGNRADYIITTDYTYLIDPSLATTTVQQIGGGGDGTDTLTNVEILEFADGAFSVADFIGPPPPPTPGDDLITGTPNADTIDLLGGNDTYYGFGGNDQITGGTGNDTLLAGDGTDTVYGGSGADWVDGGADNDTLFGGAGRDTVMGGSGNDTMYGGDGNDALLSGDEGDDVTYGQLGDDVLYVSPGTDTLNGGDGFDTVNSNGSNFSDYSITKNPDGTITLTDINPLNPHDDGTELLIHIEAIQFNDGLYNVATGQFTPSDSIV